VPPADLADVLAATSSGGGGSSIFSFLPLLLIVAVGYLLLIRPARTRQRKAMETRNSVEPGSEVTTTAGLIATVIAVDDETVTLEIAPGVHSRFLKGAIARVHDTGADEPADDEPSSPDGVSLDKPNSTEH
jgi:preprotein translocase subunit YajC